MEPGAFEGFRRRRIAWDVHRAGTRRADLLSPAAKVVEGATSGDASRRRSRRGARGRYAARFDRRSAGAWPAPRRRAGYDRPCCARLCVAPSWATLTGVILGMLMSATVIDR